MGGGGCGVSPPSSHGRKIKGMLHKLMSWKGEVNFLKGLFGEKIVPLGTLLWKNYHPELLAPEPAEN